MHKKNIILIICITTLVALSGCAGNNKQIKIKSKESDRTINVDNKDSYSSAKVDQGDDEADFSFDEVESKKTKKGYVLEYKRFEGTCAWLMMEVTNTIVEDIDISFSKKSKDIKMSLVGPDGTSKELSVGKNKIKLESGKYKIKIAGQNSTNKVEMRYEKHADFKVELNEYFNMGYDFDLGAGKDNIFSDFDSMIDTDDIKSIDDITDDMIINKQGAYFEHSSNNSKGDCLELDYEGFTGIYRWSILNIKKKESITFNITGTIEENTRLVLVQSNKSIKEIKNGDKVTLDKGKSKIVLCGYKAKGNLKIKLAYDKKNM